MSKHTDESDEFPGRCSEVDKHGMGRCVLDADHEPNWIGVVRHAWEKVPGPPGPPQQWQTRPEPTPLHDCGDCDARIERVVRHVLRMTAPAKVPPAGGGDRD